MKIAKEGYPIIAIPALLTIIALLLGWNWAAALFVIVTLAVAAFFRDPERIPPLGSDLILAPADGKVVEIRRVEEAAGDASARLSIFMSPLDVHVNRAPVSGTVQKIEYQKGCFMPAYKEECSENNERNALSLVGSDGLPVKLVQIAGTDKRKGVPLVILRAFLLVSRHEAAFLIFDLLDRAGYRRAVHVNVERRHEDTEPRTCIAGGFFDAADFHHLAVRGCQDQVAPERRNALRIDRKSGDGERHNNK